MSRVLIHACCAHCAAYTAEYWKQQGHEVGAYWYNPNIHPYTEHQARLESMRTLAEKTGLPLVIESSYDMVEYFRRVAGDESNRCRHCFDLRLSKTAEVAKQHGFDAFTTTLLISPHQQHEVLRETGEKVARQHGIQFLYADLRKRYSDSRHITKPMDLYHQQYCGCLYSELERYTEKQ